MTKNALVLMYSALKWNEIEDLGHLTSVHTLLISNHKSEFATVTIQHNSSRFSFCCSLHRRCYSASNVQRGNVLANIKMLTATIVESLVVYSWYSPYELFKNICFDLN